MSGPDLTRALHQLRTAVRQQVPVPAGTAVRQAAVRRRRARRFSVVALAAAVAAIALGGAAVLQPAAAPRPVPPAGSPPPVPEASQAPPAPFTDVTWQAATIDMPPQEGCPGGPVRLRAYGDEVFTASGPADSYPQVRFATDLAAYGDLTGDGQAEAVIGAYCAAGEEESYDGEGQLLAISRDPDGSLRGIGWVGPRGAVYHSAWIADGALYVEAHPWLGDGFEWTPGVVLRYQWDGTEFGGHQWAPEYPPILPAGEAGQGPPVMLGPVAGGLGCPDGTVRFGRDGTATVAGATYDLAQPTAPSGGPHLVDLNRTGDRLLILTVECQDTWGLGVFARSSTGFEGVSVLVPPDRILSWALEPRFTGGRLRTFDGSGGSTVYQWTGDRLQPVAG